MQQKERVKLAELTRIAIYINKELLANEKKFLEAVSSNQSRLYLQDLNEKINYRCRKERLYLGAAKSLLRIGEK
ncbi:hypothetical protein SAE01_19990 [Segetibacter aerophilus]|uniref:Uncharacterized protein n=1 Tax=Segetibacter aerophilus TaxID=670293 RepID=A0A512BC05_9BACT|nr:hypothetical protein SAE01_19990 [Segetibacter aerophilus]